MLSVSVLAQVQPSRGILYLVPRFVSVMPRFQYGTHQLYFLPDFADGAIAALAEQQQYGPRAPGIVSDFNFSRLTGKGITSLMANAKLWVPSSAKRSVNAYPKSLTRIAGCSELML